MSKRIIIAGTREFNNYELLKEKCEAVLENESDVIIISGCARGTDSLGERFAQEKGYKVERFPANWDRDGKSAGAIRNNQMANNADMLIAFWDGKSKGTSNMISTARRKGLIVKTIIVK